MQQLYQARDSLEAQQLIDRLAEEQIDAVVLGDHLSGGAGELSALVFPTVWVVDNGQMIRARGVLAAFLSQQSDVVEGTAWRCAVCNATVDAEFAVCWKCGSGRPSDRYRRFFEARKALVRATRS